MLLYDLMIDISEIIIIFNKSKWRNKNMSQINISIITRRDLETELCTRHQSFLKDVTNAYARIQNEGYQTAEYTAVNFICTLAMEAINNNSYLTTAERAIEHVKSSSAIRNLLNPVEKKGGTGKIVVGILFVLSTGAWAVGYLPDLLSGEYYDKAGKPGTSPLPMIIAFGVLGLIGIILFIWGIVQKSKK